MRIVLEMKLRELYAIISEYKCYAILNRMFSKSLEINGKVKTRRLDKMKIVQKLLC